MDKKLRIKRKLIFYGIVLLLAIISVSVLYFKNVYLNNKENSQEEYTARRIDVDEYFNENSTVVNTIKASTSETLSSEVDASVGFEQRGFTNSGIYYEYTQDGEYVNETVVSKNGTDKHPFYYTIYVSSNDDYWVIYLINDKYFANPLSYNIENETACYVSESNTLNSYDSIKDKFYETIPNDNVIDLLQVDYIDSKTLDNIDLDAR